MSAKASKPIVGVSSCLLGEKVRYDGQHQAAPELLNWLAEYVQYQSFCPEVSAGFGVPRPAIHLVIKNRQVRCVLLDAPEQDMTDPLLAGFKHYQHAFKHLSGFILKSRSPSCGPGGVKLTGPLGQYRNGQGLFVQWLSERYPQLPIVSEDRLQSLDQRRHFLQAVQDYAIRSAHR